MQPLPMVQQLVKIKLCAKYKVGYCLVLACLIDVNAKINKKEYKYYMVMFMF